MRKSSLIVLYAIAMVFYGCSTIHYMYDGEWYDSSEKALAAQLEYYNRINSTIKPAKIMLPYRAIIVLPTQSWIEENWKRTGGSQRDEILNYGVQVATTDLDKFAEAISQRRLFKEVSITKSNNPDRHHAPDYAVMIYPVIDKKEFRNQWFVKFSSKDEAIPIYDDVSLPPGSARLNSWLDYFERKAMQELGR